MMQVPFCFSEYKLSFVSLCQYSHLRVVEYSFHQNNRNVFDVEHAKNLFCSVVCNKVSSDYQSVHVILLFCNVFNSIRCTNMLCC